MSNPWIFVNRLLDVGIGTGGRIGCDVLPEAISVGGPQCLSEDEDVNHVGGAIALPIRDGP